MISVGGDLRLCWYVDVLVWLGDGELRYYVAMGCFRG